MSRISVGSFFFAFLLLVGSAPARARSINLARRLPADTIFYMYWRGGNSISPASRNALVALWNDPGFAPARALIEKNLDSALASDPKLGKMSGQEVHALLDQPIIFGARLGAYNPEAKNKKFPLHGFLVIQGGGKAGQELISLLAQSGPKAASDVKITPNGNLVAATDAKTLSDLVARFSSVSMPADSSSLSGVEAYHEARVECSGRPTLELFFRPPDLSTLHISPSPNFNTVAFLQALHVDHIHLACGEVNLNAPRELARFSILGDTSPGGPFDIFGASAPTFETLAVAPAGSSLNAFRMDLGAFVADVMNAVSAATNPAQSANVKAIVGMFSGAVLPALAGEYAVISLPTKDQSGLPKSLIAVTIRSAAADQLFSLTLAPFVHPAGQEGKITYYRTSPIPSFGINPGQKHPAAPAPEKTSADASPNSSAMFIALTPHLLLASTDEALVKATAHSVTGAAPALPGLTSEASFQAARAAMPAQLSGLDFTDFADVRWAKSLKPIATVLGKQKDQKAANDVTAFDDWLQSGGAAVLARHLHWLMVGEWKDSGGVHWRADIH